MLTTFNIGLNNNPKTYDEILDLVSRLTKTQFIQHRLDKGEYKGDTEPTIIIVVDMEDYVGLDLVAERLCERLTQECISYKNAKESNLVYHPNYRGSKFNFNDDYFLDYE